jgi:RimJ/RimL family protein N-acetyltransferase
MNMSLCVLIFLAPNLIAMEAKIEVDSAILYENRSGDKFALVPFHYLPEERAVEGLYYLLQNEKVVEYYENGCKKNKEECQERYKRVAPRFQNWQGDQLGWVAICDGENTFKGFIGGYIHKINPNTKKDLDSYTIELCFALDPEKQGTGVMSRGLRKYVSYFFPKLELSVRSKIRAVEYPVNPNNEASICLSKSFDERSVGEEVYTPPIYENIPPEKGQRVKVRIPVNCFLKE